MELDSIKKCESASENNEILNSKYVPSADQKSINSIDKSPEMIMESDQIGTDDSSKDENSVGKSTENPEILITDNNDFVSSKSVDNSEEKIIDNELMITDDSSENIIQDNSTGKSTENPEIFKTVIVDLESSKTTNNSREKSVENESMNTEDINKENSPGKPSVDSGNIADSTEKITVSNEIDAADSFGEENGSNPSDEIEENLPKGTEDEKSPRPKHRIEKNRMAFIDSDSSDEDSNSILLEINKKIDESNKENDDLIEKLTDDQNILKPQKKRMTIIDSDSEDDSSSILKEIDKNIEKDEGIKRKMLVCSDSDEDDGEMQRNKERLKNLCDSDSSAEETENFIYTSDPIKRKKNKIVKENLDKPMTGRDAKDQRREIQSESQRMQRESRIHLPYHRPKSHTLQEFLKRKSQIQDAIKGPANLPTTFAIKMNREQLNVTAKFLEEREKEIEEFYKSDEEIEKKSEILVPDTKMMEDDKMDEWNQCVEENKNREERETYEKNPTDEPEKIEELREILEKSLGNSNNSETLNPDLNTSLTILEDKEVIDEIPTLEEKISPEISENKLEQKLKKFPGLNLIENFQPRLSGHPNDLVVLNDGLEKSKGVSELMKRFLAHTSKKTHPKKQEINITNIENGLVLQETIIIDAEEENETVKMHQIPGAKIKKLREELEEQISKKRAEDWKKRQEEKKIDNEEDDACYVGEKDECAAIDEILDDEDEGDITDTDPSSEEEEEEDKIKETSRVKSAFLDQEAEDDDDEEAEDGDHDEEAEDCDDDEEDDDSTESEDDELEVESSGIKKPHKRILTAFQDDSDDDDSKTRQQVVSSSIDLFTSQDIKQWDDEDIPLHQPGLEKTPLRPKGGDKSKDLSFLTPTFHLTALQGMSSTSKIDASPVVLPLPPEPSPLKRPVKTNLFTEQSQNYDDIDDLEGLLSGKFPSTSQNCFTQESELSSGKFRGLTQLNEELKELSKNLDDYSSNNDDLDKFPETTQSGSTQELNEELKELSKNIEDSSKNVDLEKNSEEIIINSGDFKSSFNDDSSQVKHSKYVIASDSEDETEINSSIQKKKRKNYVVDDISLSDDDLNEPRLDDFDDDDNESKTVDYDSEENEIVVEKETREFFDAEAELSGSDWGSADEDEQNLDDLEFEDGDTEKIDEKKVQRELERMHVRAILDEDQRDVKLLQEMLLEDGELHGAGREKKFRWKNADSLTWDDGNVPKDDDDEVEEIESELQWRKTRHEREVFLKEKESKTQQSEDDDDLFANNSEIMKLGQAALRKSIQKTPTLDPSGGIINVGLNFSSANKRGSFLTRSETTLTRLAEITSTTNGLLNNGPKNNRNFVFSTVEKTETVTTNKKRKTNEFGTPKILKKLRIADMSPAGNKFKTNKPN